MCLHFEETFLVMFQISSEINLYHCYCYFKPPCILRSTCRAEGYRVNSQRVAQFKNCCLQCRCYLHCCWRREIFLPRILSGASADSLSLVGVKRPESFVSATVSSQVNPPTVSLTCPIRTINACPLSQMSLQLSLLLLLHHHILWRAGRSQRTSLSS